MLPAQYFCSGTVAQSEFCHYGAWMCLKRAKLTPQVTKELEYLSLHQAVLSLGLASPIYTHFTSPIRRYADLLVHRLLASCIGADATYPDLLNKVWHAVFSG